MFLCKVALDLMAKHAADGIGQMDEKTFRRDVWFHHPITDIWGIGPGIARRLARAGVHDPAGICATDPAWLRGESGRNAEWLIDHAWGLEPCTIADARGCVPKAQSLSNGQVLMRDYGFGEARVVLREMAWQSCLDLRQRELACDTMGLYVGHSGQAELFGHDGGQRGLGHQTAGEREATGALSRSMTRPLRAICPYVAYVCGWVALLRQPWRCPRSSTTQRQTRERHGWPARSPARGGALGPTPCFPVRASFPPLTPAAKPADWRTPCVRTRFAR